jgi:hypothetical protein
MCHKDHHAQATWCFSGFMTLECWKDALSPWCWMCLLHRESHKQSSWQEMSFGLFVWSFSWRLWSDREQHRSKWTKWPGRVVALKQPQPWTEYTWTFYLQAVCVNIAGYFRSMRKGKISRIWLISLVCFLFTCELLGAYCAGTLRSVSYSNCSLGSFVLCLKITLFSVYSSCWCGFSTSNSKSCESQIFPTHFWRLHHCYVKDIGRNISYAGNSHTGKSFL